MVSEAPVCPSCGKSNPDDVQYCQYCYNPMDPSKPRAPESARSEGAVEPDRYRLSEYLLAVALFLASPIWLLILIYFDEGLSWFGIGATSLLVLLSTFVYLTFVCTVEPYRNREAKPSRWMLTTIAFVAYAAVVAIAIAKLIALGEERSHPGSGLSDVTIDAVYFFLLPANSIGVFFMTILCMDRDTPRRIKTARYVLSALHAVASPTVIFVLLVMVS